MPRPSRAVDEAMLRAGRALLPRLGCRGLTQRALAAHAGVQPGMFHYHFGSKDDFLRALLQQLYHPAPRVYARGSAGFYEEMYAGAGGQAAATGGSHRRSESGPGVDGGWVATDAVKDV